MILVEADVPSSSPKKCHEDEDTVKEYQKGNPL